MTYKRQQKVKVAKEVINQETDHEALCLLSVNLLCAENHN